MAREGWMHVRRICESRLTERDIAEVLDLPPAPFRKWRRVMGVGGAEFNVVVRVDDKIRMGSRVGRPTVLPPERSFDYDWEYDCYILFELRDLGESYPSAVSALRGFCDDAISRLHDAFRNIEVLASVESEDYYYHLSSRDLVRDGVPPLGGLSLWMGVQAELAPPKGLDSCLGKLVRLPARNAEPAHVLGPALVWDDEISEGLRTRRPMFDEQASVVLAEPLAVEDDDTDSVDVTVESIFRAMHHSCRYADLLVMMDGRILRYRQGDARPEDGGV